MDLTGVEPPVALQVAAARGVSRTVHGKSEESHAVEGHEGISDCLPSYPISVSHSRTTTVFPYSWTRLETVRASVRLI